ncbi:MAG TPA: DEAD/DEAH box helicase [Acidimicrobiales bacterium]|jgi:superfamily II DNA/RNA helicase
MSVTTFSSLGVADDLVAALAELGITSPFPVQTLTIPDGLDGRDVCGKAKTGSGKTLAFGIPIVQRSKPARPRHPRALTLAPTRELASQIAEDLEPLAAARGLRVEACYGGAPIDKQIKALHHGVDILSATPGRLIDLLERGEINLSDIRVLAIDEADRMADMGFLPQVQWILRRTREKRQTLLFSATLDGEVGSLVRQAMIDPVRHEVGSSTQTVTTMDHRFLLVHDLDKVKVTAAICNAGEKTLVFCRTKRSCDRLAADLRHEGVGAAAIHGDLRQKEREHALHGFEHGSRSVLVATDVAARGLDIDGVDAVIHYDPSEDHKTYLHRSGRTARAGASGVAVTLMLWNQENLIRTLQKRLGLYVPIIEVFSNDERLKDLAGWEPSGVESVGRSA